MWIKIWVRKPQTSTVISIVVGGSVFVLAWWLVKRITTRRENKTDAQYKLKNSQKRLNSNNEHNMSDLRCGMSDGSMSIKSRGSLIYPHNYSKNTILRNNMSNYAESELTDISTSLDCGKIGLNTLNVVIEQLEDCMNKIQQASDSMENKNPDSSSGKFIAELLNFLETSYLLRERYKRVFIQQAPIISSELPAFGSLSEIDTASFVSAVEEIDFSELELQLMSNFRRPLYRSALKDLDEGNVMYRSLRTDMMKCKSDVEYIGKLICIRQGFDYLFSHPEQVDWLNNAGKSLPSSILTCLGYPKEDFEEAFVSLISYLHSAYNPNNYDQLVDELVSKGVPTLNFYDVVFERLLLDALENLSNPPSSIIVLTRNNWLSNSFKRSALDSAIWTLLTAKRKLLKYPDGFFALYYRVVETVAPALAWGFLGPDEVANTFCETLRDEILAFVRSLFAFSDTSVSKAFPSHESALPKNVSNTKSTISVSEDETDDEDDDATITAHDISDVADLYRVGDEKNEQYSGMRFTSVEELAEDMYNNMGVLGRRISVKINQFANIYNLDVQDVLAGFSNIPPPLSPEFV